MRGYEEQIECVLQYACGLPLAIVVLSRFLYNRRASDWSNALVQFKILDDPLLKKVLKGSFDDLDDDHAEAFLDIACFFIGKEIKFVEGILRSCTFLKYNGIQLLVEKSLITVVDQKIQMHSLLQEMGKEIVCGEFPSQPEKWSRLWNFEDIYSVMQNDTAFPDVEAIVLDLEDSQGRTLRAEALSYMSNLRLHIFCNVKFSGVLKNLSSNLQYISWHQYPFTSLPSSFKPDNLREMILPDSCITSIWEGGEMTSEEINYSNETWRKKLDLSTRGLTFCRKRREEFPYLKNMNLSGCNGLSNMPFFGALRGLERLDLEGCVDRDICYQTCYL